MALKQKTFVRQAGARAVLWIDPARVTHHSGSKWPVGKHRLKQLGRVLPPPLVRLLRPWAKGSEPFAIPRAHFGAVEPVTATPRYQRVADFIAHKDAVRHSAWYRDLMADLDRDGIARHKEIAMQDEAAVVDFLEGYVRKLVVSLATEGYRPDAVGFESTAVIDATGGLCKAGSGNHRFNIAKVLGVDRFPLRVVAAHEDWLGRGVARTEEVLARLPQVEAAHRAGGPG
ncbi:MAG: hypothetical protein EP318_02900 [Rhodobacteraceae bacterium]|nr:MAG: hypothetical protein EP318_02900 [Paracoccaceae bacterium]